jgi:hypothetical protein
MNGFSSSRTPMMFGANRSARFVLAIVLGISIRANSAHAQNQKTTELNVTDGRPVAAVVQELVSRYHYVITYEDPRHVYEGDLEDATKRVRKDLDKLGDKAPRVLVPAKATLSVDIPSASAINAQEMASTLQQVMQVQSRAGRGGHFRVEQVGNVFHVLPAEARDNNGNWVKQTSILDSRISLSDENRSADELMDAICKAVSAAAHVNVLLGFSLGGLSDPSHPRPYHLGVDNEPARDVLMKALNLIQSGQKLTWVLFYDPSEGGKMYFLTLEGVPIEKSPAVSPQSQRILPSVSEGSGVAASK